MEKKKTRHELYYLKIARLNANLYTFSFKSFFFSNKITKPNGKLVICSASSYFLLRNLKVGPTVLGEKWNAKIKLF